MKAMTRIALCGLAAMCLAGLIVVRPRAAAAQAELDRIVARVNNKIITQSDIRQARLLLLVDGNSDDATRRALENRLLILSEIARHPSRDQNGGDIAARRSGWEQRVGGSAKVSELLGQAAMSEGALQTWMRDDARIDAYVQHQFGSLAPGERARAQNEWVGRLRQRAGLD